MSRGNTNGQCAFSLESLETRRLLTAVTNPVVQPIDVINPGGPIIVASSSVKTAGEVIRPIVKTQFSGELGTISGVTGIASNASNLLGSIDWGDGRTSTATFIKQSNGTYEVDGSHTYNKTGQFHINILVTRGPLVDPSGPNPFFMTVVGTIHATANVRQNSPGGLTIDEKTAKSFTANVGSFTFVGTDTLGTSIDWGDGKNSSGVIKSNGKDAYIVDGTHTYKNKGDYRIQVMVTARPAPVKGGISDPIILLVASIDSTADVT